MFYLILIYRSVHYRVSHVVICGSKSTHIRFSYSVWLLQVNVLKNSKHINVSYAIYKSNTK